VRRVARRPGGTWHAPGSNGSPESSAYLDQGETLVTPVAIGTRGGRAALVAGLGIVALAVAVLDVIGNRIGEPGPVTGVFLAAAALAVVLVALGWVVAHKHAVVLTDRRLLVFRCRGIVIGHLQGVFIAVPRSDVSTGFTSRLGLASLRVEFAPATGMAPIRLDFWSVDGQIAWASITPSPPRQPRHKASPGELKPPAEQRLAGGIGWSCRSGVLLCPGAGTALGPAVAVGVRPPGGDRGAARQVHGELERDGPLRPRRQLRSPGSAAGPPSPGPCGWPSRADAAWEDQLREVGEPGLPRARSCPRSSRCVRGSRAWTATSQSGLRPVPRHRARYDSHLRDTPASPALGSRRWNHRTWVSLRTS
jgi:hypothetical protein